MRNIVILFFIWALSFPLSAQPAKTEAPLLIAIDAEFGVPGSTSAQAISLGAKIAAAEINAAGGVLGRRLDVVEYDHRAVPSRSRQTLQLVAADANVVAVMSGRFSPTVVEILPDIHRLKIPMLVPWAAADSIIDPTFSPNYVFRLSLTDSWVMGAMVARAARQGNKRIALILPNTEWGRSSAKATEAALTKIDTKAAALAPKVVAQIWYSWGEPSMAERLASAKAANADAVFLVANDREGMMFVREMANLPAQDRVPIICHWGITGGVVSPDTLQALGQIDFVVAQSFSFIGNNSVAAKRVVAAAKALGTASDARMLAAPVGLAHAYDLVHLLGMAIKKAGSADREKIRAALENLGKYDGLVASMSRPFSPERHEALSSSSVFFARYAADGAIERTAK